MDTFNSAIKLIHIENQEYVINGIKISKSKSFNANINGIEKVIEIINLPDNYKAIVGIEDSEEAILGNKTVFGKFFIKVYDSFNREVNDFLSHHKLASGLDLKLRLTNIDSPKVSIENETSKIGYYDAGDYEFTFTVYDDKPIQVVSAKSSSGSSYDPSKWWIIGGIILSVVLICGILLYYNVYYKKAAIKAPEVYSKVNTVNIEMSYKTPRFPPRYYNFY